MGGGLRVTLLPGPHECQSEMEVMDACGRRREGLQARGALSHRHRDQAGLTLC